MNFDYLQHVREGERFAFLLELSDVLDERGEGVRAEALRWLGWVTGRESWSLPYGVSPNMVSRTKGGASC